MSTAQFNRAADAFLIVCTHFGYTLDDLAGRDRNEPLATCRKLAIKLAYDATELGSHGLSKLLFRSKAGIGHNIRSANAILDTEPKYRALFDQWKARL